MDFARPRVVDEMGRAADRAGRRDHVVEHDGHLSRDRRADDVLLVRFERAAAPFVDDRQMAAEAPLVSVADGLSTWATAPPASFVVVSITGPEDIAATA